MNTVSTSILYLDVLSPTFFLFDEGSDGGDGDDEDGYDWRDGQMRMTESVKGWRGRIERDNRKSDGQKFPGRGDRTLWSAGTPRQPRQLDLQLPRSILGAQRGRKVFKSLSFLRSIRRGRPTIRVPKGQSAAPSQIVSRITRIICNASRLISRHPKSNRDLPRPLPRSALGT